MHSYEMADVLPCQSCTPCIEEPAACVQACEADVISCAQLMVVGMHVGSEVLQQYTLPQAVFVIISHARLATPILPA